MGNYHLVEKKKLADRVGVVGFWVRLVARLMDCMVMFVAVGIGGGVIVGIAYAICGVLAERGMMAPLELGKGTDLPMPVEMLGLMLAAMAWNGIMEGISGTSLGKAPFGLRVLNMQGRRASFKQALKRNLVFPFDQLLLGAVAGLTMSKTPLNQRLGDTFAETLVASRHKNKDLERLPWGRFLLGIFLAVPACGIVGAVLVLLRQFA